MLVFLCGFPSNTTTKRVAHPRNGLYRMPAGLMPPTSGARARGALNATEFEKVPIWLLVKTVLGSHFGLVNSTPGIESDVHSGYDLGFDPWL